MGRLGRPGVGGTARRFVRCARSPSQSGRYPGSYRSNVWAFEAQDTNRGILVVDALSQAVPVRFALMVQLAAWCSLRYGELAALTRAHGDVEHAQVSIRAHSSRPGGCSLVHGRPRQGSAGWPYHPTCCPRSLSIWTASLSRSPMRWSSRLTREARTYGARTSLAAHGDPLSRRSASTCTSTIFATLGSLGRRPHGDGGRADAPSRACLSGRSVALPARHSRPRRSTRPSALRDGFAHESRTEDSDLREPAHIIGL